MARKPIFNYSRWRHGGWYVDNVVYPNGAVGCVSRNYADRKWRIVCDPRPFDERPTFSTRDEAAMAEWLMVQEQTAAWSNPRVRADAEAALSLFDNYCLKPEHRYYACDVAVRLAIHIHNGLSVEEAAAREYSCRWRTVLDAWIEQIRTDPVGYCYYGLILHPLGQ